MTAMKPCPKCHSTEHLRIETVADHLNCILSAKVTREAIRQWNEMCDDWEGMFDHG